MVSQDDAASSKFIDTSRPNHQSDSDLQQKIEKVLSNFSQRQFEESLEKIPKLMGMKQQHGFKFSNAFDVKTLSNKVLKCLREELAIAQTTSIKIINCDVIEFEENQRQTTEQLRKLSAEDLIKEVHKLKQEIMTLRINEIFMRKCADQITAVKNAMGLCSLRAVQHFFAD